MSHDAEFWTRVDMSGECWIWTGTRNNIGYGSLRWGDRRDLAHRVAFMLNGGTISAGHEVMHLCDNPPCVRPDHLRLGTHSENTRRTHEQGRGNKFAVVRGEAHPHARLTDGDVDEIRRLSASGLSAYKIASQFGVTHQHIYNLLSGKRRGTVVRKHGS